MALLDFLFEGQPPPQVESFSSTSANLPDWFQSYLRGTVAKANTIAAEPFQPFPGPRLAPLSGQQQQAYDLTGSNVGTASPYFDSAGNLINTGGDASSLSAAQPFITGAGALSPTGAAAPYVAGAARTFPGALSEYLNPYTESVVNRIAELGNRNLMENILPGVQDRFITAGQPGSSRNEEFVSRAIRDTTGEIAGAQAGALERGYGQAGQLFGQDASRLGALASTTGGLAGEEMSRLGALGQLAGNLTGETAGRQLQAGTALGALGTERQTAGLRDAAALEAAGAAQQTQAQRNLDLGYEQFREERDYPRDQTTWLSNLLRGATPPPSTTTTSTAPASTVGASPLAQLAGTGLSIAALAKVFGKARGGRVRAPYRRGGVVRGALSYAA